MTEIEQQIEDLLLRRQPEPDWSDLAILGAKLDADLQKAKWESATAIANLQCQGCN